MLRCHGGQLSIENKLLGKLKKIVHSIFGGRFFKEFMIQTDKGRIYRTLSDADSSYVEVQNYNDNQDNLKKIKSVFEALQSKFSGKAFINRDTNGVEERKIPNDCFAGAITMIDEKLGLSEPPTGPLTNNAKDGPHQNGEASLLTPAPIPRPDFSQSPGNGLGKAYSYNPQGVEK
jgi:hypothetical protein